MIRAESKGVWSSSAPPILAFSVRGQDYGVDLLEVQEILPVPPLTRVWHAPARVLGVTNLRGHILALLDPGEMLGLGKVTNGRTARVVVLSAREMSAGILVESVHGLRTVPTDRVERTAAGMTGAPAEWVRGIVLFPQGPLVLLDAEQVLLSARVGGK